MHNLINAVLLSAVFNNIVFSNALGTAMLPYTARGDDDGAEGVPEEVAVAASRARRIFGISGGISLTAMLAGVLAYFFDNHFAIDGYTIVNTYFSYTFLNAARPFVYMVLTGAVYTVCLIIAWRFLPKLYRTIHKYLHVSALNSVVLGSIYLCSATTRDIWGYVGCGFGAGIGFAAAALLLAAAQKHLYGENTPAVFRGLPATFIFLGIVSLALYAI